MEQSRELLSIIASADTREIHVYLNDAGLAVLKQIVARAEDLLAAERADHLHVFSSSWAPDGELSEWMPSHEENAGATQVHHLKLHYVSGTPSDAQQDKNAP